MSTNRLGLCLQEQLNNTTIILGGGGGGVREREGMGKVKVTLGHLAP